MDSPVCFAAQDCGAGFRGRGDQFHKREQSNMHVTTVAVDLANSVFQITVADEHWRVVKTQRLTRSQFECWLLNREVALVVMEACSSAHH
jgi:transposase